MRRASKAALMRKKDLVVEQGLRLLDVVPVVFPCHALIKQLEAEKELYRRHMLTCFWKLNSHQELQKAVVACLEGNRCSCPFCYALLGLPQMRRDKCVFMGRLINLMQSAGITYFMPCSSACSCRYVGHWSWTDSNFKPDTACEYLSPVSDLDYHIVFKQYNNCFSFVYGRKLWALEDVIGSRDIHALTLFRASLQRKSPVMA